MSEDPAHRKSAIADQHIVVHPADSFRKRAAAWFACALQDRRNTIQGIGYPKNSMRVGVGKKINRLPPALNRIKDQKDGRAKQGYQRLRCARRPAFLR